MVVSFYSSEQSSLPVFLLACFLSTIRLGGPCENFYDSIRRLSGYLSGTYFGSDATHTFTHHNVSCIHNQPFRLLWTLYSNTNFHHLVHSQLTDQLLALLSRNDHGTLCTTFLKFREFEKFLCLGQTLHQLVCIVTDTFYMKVSCMPNYKITIYLLLVTCICSWH